MPWLVLVIVLSSVVTIVIIQGMALLVFVLKISSG